MRIYLGGKYRIFGGKSKLERCIASHRIPSKQNSLYPKSGTQGRKEAIGERARRRECPNGRKVSGGEEAEFREEAALQTRSSKGRRASRPTRSTSSRNWRRSHRNWRDTTRSLITGLLEV
ncbi:hypothetical protein ACS0TY_000235 [Phlomoides rotata]